ncbi:hypothetical protein [Sanguibacter antarcticus]|uniref:Uncharacterized protein n=1 Tax=Sanguibacter antarcticus TaxID=372484 RepID=A0A2A9E2P1_9MICO|nr:hypothetical protein [Sanguibacter antarcticus]PFG33103.1 hypothetical protein ATL42_0963 [Sanguibacter antarcticus]
MNPGLVILISTVTLALSVVGGWYATRSVLALAARSVAAEAADPEAAPGAPPEPPRGPNSVRAVAALRGGTWIGFLERFAVTGLVLAGDATGVAIVVAIKGLGRYPELRENPEASERFVIGTLASLVWSAGLGILGRAALGWWA